MTATTPTDVLAPILADAIADLADLQRDRDSYRLLAQAAIQHCHDLTMTVRRQQATIVRLHEIVREYLGATDDRRAA